MLVLSKNRICPHMRKGSDRGDYTERGVKAPVTANMQV